MGCPAALALLDSGLSVEEAARPGFRPHPLTESENVNYWSAEIMFDPRRAAYLRGMDVLTRISGRRVDLADKVALITRAGHGIRAATARLLVDNGAFVALLDRDALRLELAHTGASAGVAYFGMIDTGLVRDGLLNDTGLEAIVAALPGAYEEPVPPEVAARAVISGIRRRARWVCAPPYVYALMMFRTPLAIADPLVARSRKVRAAIRHAQDAAARVPLRSSLE